MTWNPAVTFNYGTWTTRFPEFAVVSSALAQLYFDEASIICRNSVGECEVETWALPIWLNLLTAHIAWLNAPRDPQGNPASAGEAESAIVGQITNASEGSVSVALKANTNPTADWYMQSRYGAEYWQMTAAIRTMHYVPQKRDVPLAIFPSVPFGRGF